MPSSSSTVPGAAARFFDNYLKCLLNASVPEKQMRWYARRVEEFIKAQNGRKIKALSAANVGRYFEMIGREKRLSGWQFRQCIDAIRISGRWLLSTHGGWDKKVGIKSCPRVPRAELDQLSAPFIPIRAAPPGQAPKGHEFRQMSVSS